MPPRKSRAQKGRYKPGSTTSSPMVPVDTSHAPVLRDVNDALQAPSLSRSARDRWLPKYETELGLRPLRYNASEVVVKMNPYRCWAFYIRIITASLCNGSKTS